MPTMGKPVEELMSPRDDEFLSVIQFNIYHIARRVLTVQQCNRGLPIFTGVEHF